MTSALKSPGQARWPWLDGAPSQWEIAPIKAKATVRNGATPSSGEERFWDGDIPWATPVDLGVLELRETGRAITCEGYESCGTSLVPAGSVIVSTRAPIGSLALAGVDMCFNQGCRGLVPDEGASGRFLYYALSAFSSVLQIHGEGTTFKELSSSSLADFPLAWPPRREQTAIATYLDAETARIDGLIEEKTRLLEYLKGMRSAIIVAAMLNGAKGDQLISYPNAPWMGRLPADWMQMTLTRVVESACDGPFGSSLKSEHYTEEGVPVIRLQNIGDGEFLAGDPAFISEEYFRELGGHDATHGDMVVASLGDERRSPGRACVVPSSIGQALVKADCFRFRLDHTKALVDFVAMQLNSLCRPFFQFTAKGTTRQRVTITDVRRCPIALPSLDEQKRVVATVTREQEEVASLLAHVERELGLLSELRSATITDAVLGRIDVRKHMKN